MTAAVPPPSFSFYDLLQACAQNGCPICRIGAHSVKRYLDSLFYEFVNDPGTRDGLLRSLGFCREHVRLLLETRIADAFGASIIYENILKKILRDFPGASLPIPSHPAERAGMIKKYISASPGRGPCLACAQRDDASERTLFELGKSLRDERLRTALQASDGLCFPHLARLLELVQDMDDVRFLMELTESKLEARRSEMGELIRKNDYRFRPEGITEAEALAWRKTMCMISGASLSLTGDQPE